MGLLELLQSLALVILFFGGHAIVDLPLWQTPLEEWTFVDFEAIGLRLFNTVMFMAVSAYCIGGLCSGIYGLLIPVIRAVAGMARAVTSLASEYSKNGAKGPALLALNMAKVALLRPWVSRLVELLVLGDEIAIVAVLVLPAALYYASVNVGCPVFAYLSGFIAGIVTPVDVDFDGCPYGVTRSAFDHHKQNPNLRYFCDGEIDGFDALAWWTQAQEDATSTWEFYLPIFIYSVTAMFCVFLVAIFAFGRQTQVEIGTQTDSTGDLKGDSNGLSEKVAQLLARIRELEGCRAISESVVTRLRGQIQLSDRTVQQQKIELGAARKELGDLRAVNDSQRSQCQALAEELSKASDDTSLNQLQQQLGQEKGLRILITYGYLALRQLAGTFVESGLGERLLFLTREIENKCTAIATGGTRTVEEVQGNLGNGLLTLLEEASAYAAEIRLSRRVGQNRGSSQDVVLLKRKLRKCKRLARFVKADSAARQDQAIQLAKAGTVGETNSVDDERMTQELDGYKQGLLSVRRELNDTAQKLGSLEQQLAESRALNESMNQGFTTTIAEKVTALQKLREELTVALQREATLKKEMVQRTENETALQKLREELTGALQREATLKEEAAQRAQLAEGHDQAVASLSAEKQQLTARIEEFDLKLGAANFRYSELGQRGSQLQQRVEGLTRQVSEKDQLLAWLRAENDGLFSKCKGVEVEIRELRNEQRKAKKESGNTVSNAVRMHRVQLVEQQNEIDDLQRGLQKAEKDLSSSIDEVAKRKIAELEAQVEKLTVQHQQQSGTEIELRKEVQDLKERLDQVGREKSTKKAVGSVFADPQKARAQKLQRDVQNLRQEAEVMGTMRDRLANEIRDLKAKYEPRNDNREPQTPLTVQGLQRILQKEKTSQGLSRP
ncbi:hypothetical protein DIZ76_011438 [Coccidioides immitis]|uniref:Uncharacterized protein n=1 Tax=Coccidioides immitis RMSCC 2394 TaxID=404692 RepID=A0A0J6XXZ2_COCIT|nr:hypothetical protein CIRG_01241 [Coccidioides immitis RMSCC 2394]TPX25980.1 hypothetical protein DIZ76_011438 [Coccidioides immitis]